MSSESVLESSEPSAGKPGAGLLHLVLDSLAVGVLVLDAEGRIILANQIVYAAVGARPDSLNGQRLDPEIMAGFEFDDDVIESTTAESVEDIHEWWRDAPTVGPQFHEVTRLRFRYEALGGQTRRGWITTREAVDDDGEPIVVVSISDITALETEREQLRERATIDVLTGLDNRAVLESSLEHLVSSAEATGQPSGSALFIDLDGFKQVNDVLGHGAGDQVLAIVGLRLRDAFRSSDVTSRVERRASARADTFAARYGGDEFVVLTDATASDEIESLITRVHDTIAGPVDLDGTTVQVEASVGWALIDPGSTVRSVLEAADRRVYEAKSRNRPPS